MAALLSGLIWMVFLPVSLVVITLYQAHVILSSRKLGVSATALAPMRTRWLQHQLGLRPDEACAKLIKVLPNHSYIGLCAVAFPVLLGHRLTGFVPKMLRYPYEGVPPIWHMNGVRSTFVARRLNVTCRRSFNLSSSGRVMIREPCIYNITGGFVVSRLTCPRPSK